MVAGAIQDGIIWRRCEAPRSHFKLLLLDYDKDIELMMLKHHLTEFWRIWGDLRRGRSPDLPPEHGFDPARLQVMIGFGHRLFDDFDHELPLRPFGIDNRWRFLEPAGPDREILPNSGLRYADSVDRNAGDAPIVVQITADTPLAVSRVQVETERYLARHAQNVEGPSVWIDATSDGFGRQDHRSWIKFHDGISNIPKGELRRQVIAIKPDNAGGQDWSINGSYCVFIKLSVNLTNWEAIDHRRQELLVGREKYTGCPIIKIDPNGSLVTDLSCPVPGTRQIHERGNEGFREPPDGLTAELMQSHVQRANHHRQPYSRVDSRRIYRQGFEFLDDGKDGLDIGLNFVSFQDDPDRTFFILTQLGWLGGVNFGGDPTSTTEEENNLLTVRMAGSYFIPPEHPGNPFPGSFLFEPQIA